MCFPENLENRKNWLGVVLRNVFQNAGSHDKALSLYIMDESRGRQVQFPWSRIAI